MAIHEVGEHKGQHFFSMDYVEGTDLSALIRDNPLPAREAADYVQRIASAIQYAHEQGTLHRDLKPSNILIDGAGEPHITDFGIAKRIESDADDPEVSPGAEGQQQEIAQLTATGAVLGTPSYMPPEQAGAKQSEIGLHSDVYSLGAILYCLLTGRPPFQAESPLVTMLQVLQQEPAALRLLNPSLSRDLETICHKCLEKDPGRRYQSAGELVDELDCYLSGKPITARPISKLERAWRWCQRKPAVAGAGIIAVILLLVLGVGGPMIALQPSTLRARADQQAQRADKAAEEAKASADQARWNLKMAERISYSSDMLHVFRDWEETNITHLKELLDRHGNRNDLKGFEWGYWNRLVNSDLLTLKGHSDFITRVSFSPAGKRIVSGSWDNTMKVWDATTGQETLTLKGHTSVVYSVSFSPDGKRIVSGMQ